MGVYCWGNGTSDQFVGVPDELVPGGHLTSHSAHTCYSLDGYFRAVTCWGPGDEGQISFHSHDFYGWIAAGDQFTCAAVKDDPGGFSVDCFGSNAPTPGLPNTQVYAVDVGTSHVCFTEGTNYGYSLSCYGENDSGQTSVPTTVPYDDWGQFVWAGWDRTCAVTFTDKELHCWGGGTSDPSLEAFITSMPSILDEEWVVLSVGHHHICGVTIDNQLICWGSNTASVLDVKGQCTVVHVHEPVIPNSNPNALEEQSTSSLSGAAAAGIAVSTVLGVVGIAFVFLMLWQRKRRDLNLESGQNEDNGLIHHV